MAAPTSITIKDISGHWTLNKGLSGDTDAVLALQGIDWIKRKTLSMVSLNLYIKQYVADGVTHIDIGQTAGSIKGDDDNRKLDSVKRERTDDLFGAITFQSRWVNASEIDDAFLGQDWVNESQAGGPNGEYLVHTYIKGKDWVANEILGFTLVGGVRRLIKRIAVEKGGMTTVVIVYDFNG